MVAAAAIITIALVRPKRHDSLRASRVSDYTLIECSYQRLTNAPTHRAQVSAACLLDRTETNVYGKIKNIESKNMAGYVVATDLSKPERNSVQSASGAWTVPRLMTTIGDDEACAWMSVGIDGFANKTRSIVRVGSASDWENGQQLNYAWFQCGDQSPMMMVNFPVNIGDSISAEVFRVNSRKGQCRLTIRNDTQGLAAIVPSAFTQAPHLEFSSAMFIVEAPRLKAGSIQLADVGAVSFHNCICMINDTVTPIQADGRHSAPIHMINDTDQVILRQTIAKTSALSPDGKSFNVSLIANQSPPS